MLFKNYQTATRSLLRNRFHTVINVVGLSMGIAFSMLTGAFVWSEYQVNHQLAHADRQYILSSEWKKPGIGPDITTLGPLAKALKDNYPGLVANYYRWDGITSDVSLGDKHFREGIQLGDSTFLTMYGFTLLHGDIRTAFTDPFSVVITDEKAIKYFGRTNVVGQSLAIGNFSGGKQDFRITGVLKSPSRNSVNWLLGNNDDQFFISSACLNWFGRNMDWTNMSIVSYVELQPGVKPEALQIPITRLVNSNAPPGLAENLHVKVWPLTSYYLDGRGGPVRKMIFTVSLSALFILVMAIINFVNLSISRSGTRMKEIGIRKVLGSLRSQLIWQFLSESILLTALATVTGLFFYLLLAPYFSAMLGKQIPALGDLPVYTWIIVPAFTLLIGYIAGLYPAFLLSALPSVDSLKGRKTSVKENVLLRKGLIGFQFATATFILVAAIIISQQIRLFFSNSLGYNKEYIISAQLPRDWSTPGLQKIEAIRREIADLPEVKEASVSYEIPNGNNSGSMGVYKMEEDSTHAIVTQMMGTDEHYADTYQIGLAAGVFFNRPNESSSLDSSRIVINEAEAKAFGWNDPATAIGKQVKMLAFNNRVFTISGVVKDFHFDLMSKAIEPLTILHVSLFNVYRFMSIKVKPGNIQTAISDLQHHWTALLQGAPFEYRFMDESLAQLYQGEMQLKKAAESATVLSLLIALLGVLGLISYSVQRRAREIAIRKVIGASLRSIVRLFVREYLPLLAIAGLVACPLAWLVMHWWLNDYATRIVITPLPFLIALLSLAVVMSLLILFMTLKAALANPVKNIKAE